MKREILAQGMCACQGTVDGTAVIVSDPMVSLDGIEKPILVCEQTNPAYTPLFFKAKGLVTDHGGIASHAAIIARELGIPCVVGTISATKSIQNGRLITVDASNGVIYG